uniref:Cytochrome b561 domain-containing protein n=1 Tax=Eucampia antarctica TaxID=49252 RepID=A0A7S2WNA4_9STRA
MSVSKKSHFSLTHHRIGLALMIIITFQVVNGFLRPAVERTSDPTSTEKNSKNKSFLKTTPRQMWQLTHSILGVIMVGVVFYQLGNGYDMFSNDFTVTSLVPYFYVYIGIMLLTFAVIKVWMLYEEYDAERNSSGVNSFAPEQKRMANEATSRGICPDSDLAPIQFSIE